MKALVPVVLLLVACRPDSDQVVFEMQAQSFANSAWSEPENLGTAINTAANEQGPSLSGDELSLYFGSDRPGFGVTDLWVAHRACRDCPWDSPVNLGPTINTAANESGPSLSVDGHLLFFTSNRLGGPGGQDLYVSHRSDPNDDLGWEPPVALGPGVNTPANEAGAEYLQSAEDGQANFYFNRGVGGTTDLYSAAVTRSGETLGPAVRIDELSDPIALDQGATVRKDGREMFFFSSRSVSIGAVDLWTATRRSIHDPWSTPVNLGEPINSTGAEQQPSLSFDGRTLLYASSRSGSVGGTDIWMVTRSPNGQ
jgi:hypothetical protein